MQIESETTSLQGVILTLVVAVVMVSVVVFATSKIPPVQEPSNPIEAIVAAVELSPLTIVRRDSVVDDNGLTFHAYELKWGEHYYRVLVIDGFESLGMTVLK